MYVDTCKSGKCVRHLPRESYREGGKVRRRTIANLSQCSGQEIKAVKWALKHKRQLDGWIEPLREGRKLELLVDQTALDEASKLDGCHVTTTNLDAGRAGQEAEES